MQGNRLVNSTDFWQVGRDAEVLSPGRVVLGG